MLTEPWLWVIVGSYLLALLFFRPASPFEWDEVQYQRALDHYDVAQHSPQPPGAPAFVFPAMAVRWLVGDPQLAIQLTAIVWTLLGLVFMYYLVLRLSASRLAALGAVVVLAVVPGFCFHANVGLSDAPATCALIVAIWACLVAMERPDRLPLASFVVAVALGIRPQLLPALAALGIAVVVAAVRRRAWRQLGWAFAVGFLTCLLLWAPVVMISGFAEYLAIVKKQADWMAAHERQMRLPLASVPEIIRYWFVSPLGTRTLARIFYLLAATGALVLWRRGRTASVLIPLSAAAPYLAVSLYSLNMLTAVRYSLPAMLFVSVLVAGNLSATGRTGRIVGTVVVAGWCVAALGWGLPVYLQRREPAPVWQALERVASTFRPETTHVVYDGAYEPHARYVLGRRGFEIEEMVEGQRYDPADRPGRELVLISSAPIPNRELVFEARWPEARRVLQLAYWRYDSCTVQRARGRAGEPMFSPAWVWRKDDLILWGAGTIWLNQDAQPRVVKLCPLNLSVTVNGPGYVGQAIAPGNCAELVLLPGAGQALTVGAPPLLHVAMRKPEITMASREAAAKVLASSPAVRPLQGQEGFVIPIVARLSGWRGSRWVSSASVHNRGTRPLTLRVAFLPGGLDNAVVPSLEMPLAPGQRFVTDDILRAGGFAEGEVQSAGAMLVLIAGDPSASRAERSDLVLAVRTADVNAKGSGTEGSDVVPIVPLEDGLSLSSEGQTREIEVCSTCRVSVGALALSREPVEIVFSALAADRTLEERKLIVPTFGHGQRSLLLPARTVRIRAAIGPGPAGARVYPYVSIVDGATGHARYLDVERAQGTTRGTVPELPLTAEIGPR